MGDKTGDTQPNVFIEGEKLILGVCSRRQRDRGRQRGSGLGFRYERTTVRQAGGTEPEKQMKRKRGGRGGSVVKCS